MFRSMVALGALVALFPATASAATYDNYFYVGQPGEVNNVVVTTVQDAGGYRVVFDDVVKVEPIGGALGEDIEGTFYPGPCTRPAPADPTILSCRTSDRDGVDVRLGDQNDRLSYSNTLVGFNVVGIRGDGGKDTIAVQDTRSPPYRFTQGGGTAGVVDVQGGPGNDSITGNVRDASSVPRQRFAPRRSNPYFGGAGKDRIACGALPCGANGGSGNDVLVGGPAADFLSGGGGADTLRGQAGADHLCGGTGRDRIFGGSGRDVMNPGYRTVYNKRLKRSRQVRDRGPLSGGPGKDRLVAPGKRDSACP